MTDHAALTQQLDRWEKVAQAAGESGSRWETYPLPDRPNCWTMTGVGVVGDEMGHRTETMFPADAAHIAAWDPARVLALVAGLRAIVQLADDWGSSHGSPPIDASPLAQQHAAQLLAAVASVFAGEETSHE